MVHAFCHELFSPQLRAWSDELKTFPHKEMRAFTYLFTTLPVALWAALCIAGSATAAAEASAPHIVVPGLATFQGRAASGADAFLGIPFSIPPVGSRRFAPAQIPKEPLAVDPNHLLSQHQRH